MPDSWFIRLATSGLLAAAAVLSSFSASSASMDCDISKDKNCPLIVRQRAPVEGASPDQLAQKFPSHSSAQQKRNGDQRQDFPWQEFHALNSSSRELAFAAIEQLDSDPELSIILSLHAVAQTYPFSGIVTREAAEALRKALMHSRLRLAFEGVKDVFFSDSGDIIWLSMNDEIIGSAINLDGESIILSRGVKADFVAVNDALKTIAAVTADGKLTTFRFGSTKESWSAKAHEDKVNKVAIDPSGRFVATASDDETAKIWDVDNGRLLHTLEPHQNEVTAVDFNSNGTLIATGDETDDNDTWISGGLVYVWDAKTGKLLDRFPNPRAAIGDIDSLVFHPHKNQIAASTSGEVTVFDVDSKSQIFSLSSPADLLGRGVRYSLDGTLLVTLGKRGFGLWDSSSGKQISNISVPADTFQNFALSPDNQNLAALDGSGKVRIFETGNLHGQFVAHLSQAPTTSPVLQDDGSTAYFGGGRGTLFAIDTRLGSTSGRTPTDVTVLKGSIEQISAGRQKIAVFGHERNPSDESESGKGVLRLVERGLVPSIGVKIPTGCAEIVALAFSPSEDRLAGGADDGQICVWDTARGKTLVALGGGGSPVSSIAFSASGNFLASSTHNDPDASNGIPGSKSKNTAIEIWNLETKRAVLEYSFDSQKPWRVAFVDDGRRVVASDETGLLKEWDIASKSLILDSDQPYGLVGFGYRHEGGGDSISFLNQASDRFDVSIMELDVEQMITLARVRYSRDLTDVECRKYLHAACSPLPWPRTVTHLKLGQPTPPVAEPMVSPQLGEPAAKYPIGQPMLLPQLGSTAAVQEVVFSPDGKTLTTSGGVTILWDVARATELSRAPEMTSIVFSGDGHRILGIADGEPVVWEPQANALKRHFAYVDAVRKIVLCEKLGLLIGSQDHGLVSWKLDSGNIVAQTELDSVDIDSFAVSQDCSKAATASKDGHIAYWDPNTLKLTGEWASPRAVSSLSFSRTGRRLAMGHTDGVISLWEFGPPFGERQFVGMVKSDDGNHPFPLVLHLSFSKDENRVVGTNYNGTAIVIDFASSEIVSSFRDQSSEGKEFRPQFASAALSPTDSDLLATAGYGSYATLWNVQNAKEVTRLDNKVNFINALSFSKSSLRMIVGNWDGTAHVWDLVAGKILERFHQEGEMIAAVLSADGRYAVTGGSGKVAAFWEVDTGKQLASLQTSAYVESAGFLPTGDAVLLGTYGDALLWKPSSGAAPTILHDGHGPIPSLSISADGRYGITGSTKAVLWNLKTTKMIRSFVGLGPEGTSLGPSRIAPSGKFAVSGDASVLGTAVLVWDTETGKPIMTLVDKESQSDNPFPSKIPLTIAISPDEKTVVTGDGDGKATLWDLGEQRVSRSWTAHSAGILAAAFSPDGHYLVTGGMDGNTKIWRSQDNVLVATLIALLDGNIVIFDSKGGFDASNPEAISGINWAMPDDPLRPLPPEIFMRDYFEPNLLGRLLACHGAEASGKNANACKEAFKPVGPLASLNRIQPDVRIVSVKAGPTPDVALVEVEASGKVDATQPNGKTSTGVYDVRLFRDGQIVGQWPELKDNATTGDEFDAWRSASQVEMAAGKTVARHVFPVRLAGGDRGKKVTFTAYGFNEDRVKSATATDENYTVPQDIAVPGKPRAYVVTVGVNEYENDALRLNFAVADAGAIETALQGIKGYDVVPVLLTSDYARQEGNKQIPAVDHATKADIRAVLDLLAGKGEAERSRLRQELGPVIDKLVKVTPDDLVVLAFSGHGHNEQGHFYILPSDSGNDLTKLDKLIASEELTAWLRDVDAGEMVMIVDACHSAAGVPAGFKPGPMGDRGLGQLAYDKGMRILVATQADDVALESGSLGQGLLTYALKEGLTAGTGAHKPADTDGDGAITMKEWLTYAETRVPGLYQDVLAGKIRKTKDSSPDPNLLEDTTRHAQTPALFDFARSASQVVILQ